jgi:cytoskeletal protein CcmA (bactofilin family)
MFNKGLKEGGEKSPDEAETIIGPSVKIEGDFKSNGNVTVAGVVVGKLVTTQNLRIEEKAKVSADVEAKEAIIAGEVNGPIKIKGHLEILSTAKINGDIHTKSIAIEQGAQINGHCNMSDKSEGIEKSEKSNPFTAPTSVDKRVL